MFTIIIKGVMTILKIGKLRHRGVKSHSRHMVALGLKPNTVALELTIPVCLCVPLLMR